MRHALLLLLLFTGPLWAEEPLRMAVAANFRGTLEQLNTRFQQDTGYRVVLSSASTGVLYAQIKYGAPFHLFFAADREAPTGLLASGIGSHSFCYAVGSLTLTGGKLAHLADPNQSLAIANPATAPYGRAAMEVLAREEFKAGQERKLVRGNNVVQAYQYWHSGAVDLAMVARSLAPDGATPVPPQWHLPLEQHALVLEQNTQVDAYVKWINSDAARTLITEAGYLPCS